MTSARLCSRQVAEKGGAPADRGDGGAEIADGKPITRFARSAGRETRSACAPQRTAAPGAEGRNQAFAKSSATAAAPSALASA